MKPKITLRAALADPGLLGSVLAGPSWLLWRTVLIASMGEPLTDPERETFRRVSGGRAEPPSSCVEEALYLVGRRGGKDRAASTLAVYIAGLCDHSAVLAAGERGVVLCIAPDQRQAQITLDYIEAAFRGSPLLATLIDERIADVLRLTSGIDIEVRAASFRRLRGLTCLAVIASEAAFWMNDESTSNADSDILAAVRPALATTNGPLILITTPYARRGEVWELYRRHYGPEGDPGILVVQGTSRQFNETLPQAVVDRALERDHAAASAEYLATFRTDIESFVAIEAVRACVDQGQRERPPLSRVQYHAFCDPSAGSSDSMTLAIAHREPSGVGVLDCLRERRPPFSPEDVVAEFSEVLRSYRIRKVIGDRFGGEWCVERFRVHEITYEASARPKSDLYRDCLPLINSGRVRLLDSERLVGQLCGLERRTARSGRDSIDHAPGGHDDLCNAVAGVLTGLAVPQYDSTLSWVSDPSDRRRGAYRNKNGTLMARMVPWRPFGLRW